MGKMVSGLGGYGVQANKQAHNETPSGELIRNEERKVLLWGLIAFLCRGSL